MTAPGQEATSEAAANARQAGPGQGLDRDRPARFSALGWSRAGETQRARGRTNAALRRWTINGDFLSLKSTGVARYAREVTSALDALIGEQHPLTQDLTLDIVAPCPADDSLALRHIGVSMLPELRPHLPQVWVQVQLPGRVPDGLLSFCNLAPVRAKKHIVCIHDLQTRTTPESYGRLFRLMHRLILPPLAKRAAIVTTVSAASKSTLVDFALAPPDKIAVVPNGSDHALRWEPQRAMQSWHRDRPFVLCMGRNEAHKNMRLIWRLAPRLHAIGIDVVVAGAFDSRSLDAEAGGRPINLHCVGRVSDHDLAHGFSEALGFVFPSRTEGFGLPAIEAMACGCPVIASRTPCLMELCGAAALSADPDDVEEWVETVQRLARQPGLAEAFRIQGRLRARDFAWREAAQSYLRLMLQVDRMHGSKPGG